MVFTTGSYTAAGHVIHPACSVSITIINTQPTHREGLQSDTGHNQSDSTSHRLSAYCLQRAAAVPTAKGPHRCCHLPNKVEHIDRALDIPYTLQICNVMRNATETVLPLGDLPPPLKRFLGPTRVHAPNSILIGSAVLAQLTAVSNRHIDTDHGTSLTIGCMLLCSVA